MFKIIIKLFLIISFTFIFNSKMNDFIEINTSPIISNLKENFYKLQLIKYIKALSGNIFFLKAEECNDGCIIKFNKKIIFKIHNNTIENGLLASEIENFIHSLHCSNNHTTKPKIFILIDNDDLYKKYTSSTRNSSWNINAGNINANTISASIVNAGSIKGTLATPAQTNITSIGTLTGLTMGGTINLANNNITSGGSLTANQINATHIDCKNITASIVAARHLAGTLTTAAQPNITSTGTLTGLTMDGAINLANNNITNGGSLTANAVNATTVTATNLAGRLSTAAQPNITSVGNLTSLTMTGTLNLNNQNITSGKTITANTVNATNVAGTLTTAAQPNITSTGALTGLTMGGAINLANNNITNGGSLTANTVNATTVTATNVAGTVTTAAQPNITSLGSLASLTMTGTLNLNNQNITNGKIIAANTVNATAVTATNLAGRLSTAAQPNITSVGNLTSLTMTGTLNLNNQNITNGKTITANAVNATTVTATNVEGTVTTAAQPNITSTGALTGLTMGGAINLANNNITNGGSLAANTINATTVTATNVAGTLTTAAQPNITSTGTLTGLTLNGLMCLQGIQYATASTLSGSVTISASTSVLIVTVASKLSAYTINLPTTPVHGQILTIIFEGTTINKVTFSGGTIANGPIVLSAYRSVQLFYNNPNLSWYIISS